MPPSKRTPEVEHRLLEALQAGAIVQHACDYAGIHKDTFYSWCADDPYFADATTRARGSGAVVALTTISAAAASDWKAADCLLRNAHSRAYGAKQIEVSGPDGGAIQVDVNQELSGLDDDELLQMRALLAKAKGMP
jgi:hypothetical protein